MRGFRAWHTKLNRYLKDDEFYIRCDGKVCADADGLGYEEAFDTIDFDNGYIIREDDTGLKDKNGKEICEGDILDDGEGHIGKVLYNERIASFAYEWGNCGSTFMGLYTSDMKVIGNIHENPELLGEDE